MIKSGDKVKMSEALKLRLMGNCTDSRVSKTYTKHVGLFHRGECTLCSVGHIVEFGNCIGIVLEELPFADNDEFVDVRWQPSNLKYCYSRYDLVKVR